MLWKRAVFAPRRTLLQYADAIAIDFHDHNPAQRTMKVRQAVIAEPFKVEVREVDLPDPAPNQILVECEFSAISAGTELAVYTGSHQWLKDPKMMDWKFPFRPGYSAAGRVVAVGSSIEGYSEIGRASCRERV